MHLEFHRYGPRALLISFAGAPDKAAFFRQGRLLGALKRHAPAGLLEAVPSFTRILLVFSESLLCDAAIPGLAGLGVDVESGGEPELGRLVELPVAYGGPDLERVAQSASLSPNDVVSAHAAPEYLVHCLGFSPGFPYLGGLDRRLETPRLPTPRVRVPSGSVAIGGGHTGVYSVTGPGGWNLVGASSIAIFSPWAPTLREQFAVMPGDRVRFIPQGWRDSADWMKEPAPRSISEAGEDATNGDRPVLRVLSPGLGITIQDAGRPGFRRLGVPPSGAMDPTAARWANRLLDNPPELPVLECCLQGQRIEVRSRLGRDHR
ncbi:MAG: carboxyltransferase domain-containing protein [Verrucomicrobiota bacterium]